MLTRLTLIRQSINHLKIGLIVNSIIIIYQTAINPKIKVNVDLENLLILDERSGPGKVLADSELVTYNFIELIQSTISLMSIENTKLYFLLIYSAVFILLVLFLEMMNRKKKHKYQEAGDSKEQCFVEKILIRSNEKINKCINHDKDLMSCEVKEEILKKLALFEEGTKYTDKNFNLSALSVKLKTNTKYLSYIINKYKKKDFNSYINELRILYIIKKMETNPAYLNYKISYLADECGFSSHSKFTSVFKSVVGMSPSRFMDLLTKRTK